MIHLQFVDNFWWTLWGMGLLGNRKLLMENTFPRVSQYHPTAFRVTTWTYSVGWSAGCRIQDRKYHECLTYKSLQFSVLVLRTVTEACLQGPVALLSTYTNDHPLWAWVNGTLISSVTNIVHVHTLMSVRLLTKLSLIPHLLSRVCHCSFYLHTYFWSILMRELMKLRETFNDEP